MPVVAVNDATICKGSGATLNATGASTYTWSGTDLNTTNGATVIASPQATTTYTVNAQSSAGCTGSAKANVTVKNCMFVKAIDTTFCIGNCATLKALASIGDPPYTYTWSGGNADGATVCPTVTTNYTVTALDVNGNSASDILTVTIENKPTITANPVSVCIGNCAKLKANGALTYTWSPTTGLNTNTGDTVSACNLQNDETYLITGSTAAGCTNTSTVKVSIMPLPTIAVNPATICKGFSAVLTATGAINYIWAPNSGLISNLGSTVTASPSVSTTYTVVGQDANKCLNSTTVLLTVNPLPTITTNSESICIGRSTTLTSQGALVYFWSPASSLNTTNGDIVIATPSVTTNYTIKGVDANGCTNTTTATVWVEPIPTLSASNVTLCLGTPTTLTVSGAKDYVWSPSVGLNSTTGSTVNVNITTTATYTVLGTTAAGCTNLKTITVTVNIPPVITATDDTICARTTAILNAKGALKYTWTPGSLKGATINITPGVSTTYTVTGEDNNGCTGTTTAFVFVKPTPIADFIADPDVVSIEEPYITFYNTTTNGATYLWKLGDGTIDSTFDILNHKYPEPGTYEVCLDVANNGCYGNICKTVKVLPVWTFYVPNAFSPNGDGLNDGFIGVGTNILQYEMWIFDRWGNMIYHCNEMDKPWNGRRENNLSNDVGQEDVYVWKIKLTDVFEKKHVYIGHVTLVR